MNIRSIPAILCLLAIASIARAQDSSFKVNSCMFLVKNKTIANEWATKDTARELYLLKGNHQQYVTTYYTYQDEGGDCNNLFWTKEWLRVKGNKLIITTHHFQKTGLDPITEWEKKTFTVSANSEVELTEHLYKQYGSDTWKPSEE